MGMRDINESRSVSSARVNSGLSREILTENKFVSFKESDWLQLSNISTKDVVLPKAPTIIEGWSIIVGVDSDSVASVNVKSYNESSPVLLKNVGVGETYEFTLLSNLTNEGEWNIHKFMESEAASGTADERETVTITSTAYEITAENVANNAIIFVNCADDCTLTFETLTSLHDSKELLIIKLGDGNVVVNGGDINIGESSYTTLSCSGTTGENVSILYSHLAGLFILKSMFGTWNES